MPRDFTIDESWSASRRRVLDLVVVGDRRPLLGDPGVRDRPVRFDEVRRGAGLGDPGHPVEVVGDPVGLRDAVVRVRKEGVVAVREPFLADEILVGARRRRGDADDRRVVVPAAIDDLPPDVRRRDPSIG